MVSFSRSLIGYMMVGVCFNNYIRMSDCVSRTDQNALVCIEWYFHCDFSFKSLIKFKYWFNFCLSCYSFYSRRLMDIWCWGLTFLSFNRVGSTSKLSQRKMVSTERYVFSDFSFKSLIKFKYWFNFCLSHHGFKFIIIIII